jgi:hypothetical protein
MERRLPTLATVIERETRAADNAAHDVLVLPTPNGACPT